MLKTVLETTDGLDEAVAKLYTETDGKFILQVEGVDSHPDVANLKSAYETVKANLVTAKAEREKFKTAADGLPDDFDLAKWEKLKDGKPDEAALIALRQELEAERDEWKGKYEGVSVEARKTAVERDLVQELTAAGVTNPSFVKAAQTMLASAVQVGDDGKAFVETDMGPLSLTDHVKRWTNGDGKDFVTAPKGSGSKTGDGTGKPNNPLMDKVPALADLPES